MEISASSKTHIPFSALIVAGGSGARLGGEVPKQYQKINGKAILRHTIEAFLACPELKELRVVIHPDHTELYEDAVTGLSLPAPVLGGKERKDSSINGINSFSNLKNEDILLIHDAARPFISQDNIRAVVAEVANSRAATLACRVTDTQKYDGGEYVDRNNLWSIQTPQGFHYGLIKEAHESANDDTVYTDDTSLVVAIGTQAKMVEGPRSNIKITTPDDLELAKKMMAPTVFETRTGMGFDVHAFTEGDKVRLCGIDIPHTHSLKGHSDADAGLHAITDALLGTIGAGDIGTHFPPSDPQWKDADSAIFLEKAVELVKQAGGAISNMDLTIICETPKIGPHSAAMQARIGQICGLSPDRIGLKATTTERLGFTGRGEGLAAQAVVSVRFPVEG